MLTNSIIETCAIICFYYFLQVTYKMKGCYKGLKNE